MSGEPDVIIVGAGAAGLAAAGVLCRGGRTVLLLEARQRIGGRIFTLRDPVWPVPVELGAEFVHGMAPEIWKPVRSGELAAIEISGDHRVVENGTSTSGGDMMERLGPIMARMAEAPEQSFKEYIGHSGLDAVTRAPATRYIEGFNAASAGRVSTHWLAAAERASDAIEGDRSFRLVGGYASLVEWLWNLLDPERVSLQLGSVVEEIAWRPGQAEIRLRRAGNGGTAVAPKVIVTVPLGVLQATPGETGAIRFDPEPENLQAARQGIVTGHAERITMRFRRPVWEDRPEFARLGFLISGETWMPTWWTTSTVHSPVITGWTGGPAADRGEGVAGALRTLSKLLAKPESDLAGELVAWHTHDWRSDPFARGAYSYVQVGGMESQRRFGEPLLDTLYFAGEAVDADGHSSTVHGAIASGERAARLILGNLV